MIMENNGPQFMGQWGELAASAFGGGLAPTSGGGPAGASVSTTVSPTFQQSFTPQVSPVIQVSQGGGEQRGSTSQVAPGGQQAKGGDTAAPSPGFSPSPGYGYSPSFQDSGSLFDNYGPASGDYGRDTFADNGGAMMDYLPLILGGLAIAGAIILAARR